MLVIADSSALVALATCDVLDILPQIFDEIRVPEAVYREVVVDGKPLADELKEFLASRVTAVTLQSMVVNVGGLGAGELEAMALYKSLTADYLLIDDRRARRIAEANGIECIGSLWVLLEAKRDGKLRELKPLIDKLRVSSLRFSEAVLQRVLELAQEV